MIKKFLFIYILISSLFFTEIKTRLAQGNITDGTSTFSFEIGNSVYSLAQNRLWTAASTDLTGQDYSVKKYALSFVPNVLSDGSKIEKITAQPMTMKNSTVYTYDTGTELINKASEATPFLNGRIVEMVVSGNYPIIIPYALVPNSVYFAKDIQFLTDDSDKNVSEFYKYTLTTVLDEFRKTQQ